MSIKGPLVAECEGVSAEERAAFVAKWTSARACWAATLATENELWRAWPFTCCYVTEYWAADTGIHTPPPCPNCDPVGARSGDTDAIAALASDISRDAAMLKAVVKSGPERVAVLLDVHQDGQPLGRLQHPDDAAEIERLRAELAAAQDYAARMDVEF